MKTQNDSVHIWHFHLIHFLNYWSFCSSAAEKSNQVSGEANSNQSAEEERGDLIQFYNSVFVLKVKSFALRYATNDNRVQNSVWLVVV